MRVRERECVVFVFHVPYPTSSLLHYGVALVPYLDRVVGEIYAN